MCNPDPWADTLNLLIGSDQLRAKALSCVAQLNLPDHYIAAGFIRNRVWDHLHGYTRPTPLNDIDLIYFDPAEQDECCYLQYEQQLRLMMPEVQWQVRNQALMHLRNGDRPYQNSLDAMGFWPEKETAVGVRKDSTGRYIWVSAFGFESLFNLQLSHNPARSETLFNERLQSKRWLEIWPHLAVVKNTEI
ncbi:MAG: nucleotidyltransferase family protein [Amphritea sp.]|nr:nucleotidyltransferase family protein [Amphritea sp.]